MVVILAQSTCDPVPWVDGSVQVPPILLQFSVQQQHWGLLHSHLCGCIIHSVIRFVLVETAMPVSCSVHCCPPGDDHQLPWILFQGATTGMVSIQMVQCEAATAL